MELILYIFSKRKNSTARPSSGGISINVNLKNGTNVLNPAFLLTGDIEAYQLYNYAKWNDRYYFINNIQLERNNLLSISLSIDVLATYKSEIGNYTCFVERSASDYDIMLNDNYLSQRLTSAVSTTSLSSPLPRWSETGSFIVRTIGQASNASSIGITSYSMTSNQLYQVLRFLFTESNFDFLVDTSVKSFFNPFQYIVSVDWFPFNVIAFGTSVDTVKLGWWDSGINANIVDKTSLNFTIDVDLPESVYSDFRRKSMYWTILKLNLPGAGVIYLNPYECSHTLSIFYAIDIATGETLIRVYNKNSSYLICTASGKMSSSISIGQLQTNEVPNIKNALSGIGSLLSGDIFGALNSVVDTTINTAQPTPCINGSAGNMGAILNNPRITISMNQYESKDFPLANCGRPLMQNVRIGSLTGYVKCGNASLNSEALDTVKDAINNYLNGGFYYE